MARIEKAKAAAPETAQDAVELHDPYQDLQEPEAAAESAETPLEGCGEIVSPEDEVELLGCQDGEDPDPPIEYAVSADPGLNLREAPGKAAPLITELPRGVGVRPTGVTQGTWCEVTTGRLAGWVLGEFLEPLWND